LRLYFKKDFICSKDCPMDDDELNCRETCTPKSICSKNPNVTCIQHPALGQLCRCVQQGYRLIRDPLQKNNQICQG
jgi:hypothetical protein